MLSTYLCQLPTHSSTQEGNLTVGQTMVHDGRLNQDKRKCSDPAGKLGQHRHSPPDPRCLDEVREAAFWVVLHFISSHCQDVWIVCDSLRGLLPSQMVKNSMKMRNFGKSKISSTPVSSNSQVYAAIRHCRRRNTFGLNLSQRLAPHSLSYTGVIYGIYLFFFSNIFITGNCCLHHCAWKLWRTSVTRIIALLDTCTRLLWRRTWSDGKTHSKLVVFLLSKSVYSTLASIKLGCLYFDSWSVFH